VGQWTWLGEAVVLAMHEDQLSEHGGGVGIRDRALLQTALAKPMQAASYGDPSPDLAALAAAYAYGIAHLHPFIDGNKRSAFAVTYTFLVINGARLAADADEIYRFISGLYEAGSFKFEHLVRWLRAHVSFDDE
jgi:death-on-curing protein